MVSDKTMVYDCGNVDEYKENFSIVRPNNLSWFILRFENIILDNK